jgi:hypothetical protein
MKLPSMKMLAYLHQENERQRLEQENIARQRAASHVPVVQSQGFKLRTIVHLYSSIRRNIKN